ncbi:ATP-binding cassette domain-containing protein [Thalassobacillus sp. CUG 92003]|uniref:ABC transporter ATP-binding protein n=1 Tax=Thalassobacillus sp. CUG 92003 TaxID=2736641 RepID=UPI0021053BF5|nr:phosphate ABC transporter ATP-binding protein [Thalassobacillus sp. CUG 92003]
MDVFRFERVTKAPLRNLNFSIQEKDKVMIFGPSGAGKSSLLFLFNRLSDPDEGVIYLQNQPIIDCPIPTLRKRVGLVLQAPHLFPGTVKDNIKYGPSLFGEWQEEQAEQLLDYVQLPMALLNRDVEDLSGGEKQRVSLARTLANSPDVLLLDEPTSSLDYRTAEEIEEVLECLSQEHRITLIMVTHNLKQAERLGDKGFFMMNGEIVESGDLQDLLYEPTTDALNRYLDE